MRTHAVHAGTHFVGHEHPARVSSRRLSALDHDVVPLEVTHEQIASRAYEIYRARGGGEGGALGDWLAAERELKMLAMMVPLVTGRPRADRSH